MPTKPTRPIPFLALLCTTLTALPSLAPAQTIPVEDHHRARIAQCRMQAVNRPADALRLADVLLAEPKLPAGTEAMVQACRVQAYYTLGDQPRTQAALERLRSLIDSPGMPQGARIDARLVLSSALTMSGDTEQGLDILESVLDEVAARGDQRTASMALRGIGFIHAAQLNDPEGALPYFDQAIAALEDAATPLQPQDAMLYYNRAYTLLRLDRFDEADAAYRRVEAVAAALPGQEQLLRRAASNRAEITLARGDAAGAIADLQRALAWQRQNGDAQGATESQLVLARALMSLGRHGEAKPHAEAALTIAQNGSFLPEVRRSLLLLAEIAAALGDHTAAADYAARARELDDAPSREGTVSRLERLRATTERGDRSEIASRINDQSRERVWRLVALAAVALAAASIAFALARTARRRRSASAAHVPDPLDGPADHHARNRFAEAAGRPSANPSALLLLEIDPLSGFEPLDGASARNAARAHVVGTLRQVCDEHDLVARWGDMQFVVLRRNTSPESAFALAEQLRSRIATLSMPLRDAAQLAISVSTGVSSIPFSSRGTARARLADAMRVAEHALAASRSHGPGGWTGFWTSSPTAGDPQAFLDAPEAALSSGRVISGSNWLGWSPTSPKRRRP